MRGASDHSPSEVTRAIARESVWPMGVLGLCPPVKSSGSLGQDVRVDF